ncbi:MAG: family protein phosphatase, partial [Pseudomonadota bacterium]|nr:family protein phosphatase [Pseudomonadota bacterium]
LATDGFWGTLPPDMLAVSLKQTNLLQAVPMLMNQAESRGGPYCDNVSVVAVRWEDSYVQLAQSSVSTQTMALDEVTTKLDEFGRNPAYKMDLSDDEIEKAIQEIRSTIDKYSPKK